MIYKYVLNLLSIALMKLNYEFLKNLSLKLYYEVILIFITIKKFSLIKEDNIIVNNVI